MSIRRIGSSPPPSLALMREARAVFANALGLAVASAIVFVLGGAVELTAGFVGVLLFAGFLAALDRRLVPFHPYSRLGIANRITLVRAAIAFLIAGRVIDAAALGTAERWVLVALAGAALMLDGADGWAARRQGLTSAFGARFDMEVDAFAIAVLAIAVVKADAAPYWVLAIGAMRYLYLAAAGGIPPLRQAPPPGLSGDRRRKTIAVVQNLALIFALVPATPLPWSMTACALALALLIYSFAADIVMLLSRHAD